VKGLFTGRIIRTERLSPTSHLVVFEKPRGFPDSSPGQFVSLRVTPTIAPLLRRPFSIMDQTETELHFLVKVVGKGSEILAHSPCGTEMDIAGPLGGSGFPSPDGGNATFIAGGTGLAPMIFATRTWKRKGSIGRSGLIYGAGCEEELLVSLCREDFTNVHAATLDGSCGFEGDAVSLLENLIDGGETGGGMLYSCGPAGMIRAIEERAAGGFARHMTSLESVMACGVGACRGCTVPVKTGEGSVLRAVCSDGTVFDASSIDWERWEE
jgi:dihydroorotate dehydrogenase electron transfer subunit